METSELQDRARRPRTVGRSCSCSRRMVRLLPKFSEEPGGTLDCSCKEYPHLGCKCSETPWRTSAQHRISDYVRRETTRLPADFDDPSDPGMFDVGRFLHCVVRGAANLTTPNIPRSIRLHEYEDAVFRGKPRNDIFLDVPDRSLAAYFRGRTFNCHRDLVRKFWSDEGHFVPYDSDLATLAGSHDSFEPIFISTGPGQTIFEVLHMPDRSWRTSYQVVSTLITAGLVDDVEDAYSKVLTAGWPECKTKANLISRISRAKRHLVANVTDSDQSQIIELARLCREKGPAVAIPWLISAPKDQQKFFEMYCGDL